MVLAVCMVTVVYIGCRVYCLLPCCFVATMLHCTHDIRYQTQTSTWYSSSDPVPPMNQPSPNMVFPPQLSPPYEPARTSTWYSLPRPSPFYDPTQNASCHHHNHRNHTSPHFLPPKYRPGPLQPPTTTHFIPPRNLHKRHASRRFNAPSPPLPSPLRRLHKPTLKLQQRRRNPRHRRRLSRRRYPTYGPRARPC